MHIGGARPCAMAISILGLKLVYVRVMNLLWIWKIGTITKKPFDPAMATFSDEVRA